MTSTKSYQRVLRHVFHAISSDDIRNFTRFFHTFCGNSHAFPHLFRIRMEYFPHLSASFRIRMEYEKALVSSYYHNNDRLERCYE